jgi:hypothetical protein
MVAYLCIVAIVAIPAARAVERTICKFTIDNRVSLADVDGVSLHIDGNINDWRVVETIEFDGDAERLTICGYDDDNSHPSKAGFLLKCTGGWWDGVKSDTSWYVTHGDGHDVERPIGQVRSMSREEWQRYWMYGVPPAMEINKAVVSTSGFNCGGGLCDQGEKIWGKRGRRIFAHVSTFYINYPICFTKFLPRSDSECHAAMQGTNFKCQFTSHCEYRYKFGDLSVDESCRLIRTPAPSVRPTPAPSVRPTPAPSVPPTPVPSASPTPMGLAHRQRECETRGLDLGKSFDTLVEALEFAAQQDCHHLMWSPQHHKDFGSHCCVDDGSNGRANTYYEVWAVPPRPSPAPSVSPTPAPASPTPAPIACAAVL